MRLLHTLVSHDQAECFSAFLRRHSIYSNIFGAKGQGYRVLVNDRDFEEAKTALALWQGEQTVPANENRRARYASPEAA